MTTADASRSRDAADLLHRQLDDSVQVARAAGSLAAFLFVGGAALLFFPVLWASTVLWYVVIGLEVVGALALVGCGIVAIEALTVARHLQTRIARLLEARVLVELAASCAGHDADSGAKLSLEGALDRVSRIGMNDEHKSTLVERLERAIQRLEAVPQSTAKPTS